MINVNGRFLINPEHISFVSEQGYHLKNKETIFQKTNVYAGELEDHFGTVVPANPGFELLIAVPEPAGAKMPYSCTSEPIIAWRINGLEPTPIAPSGKMGNAHQAIKFPNGHIVDPCGEYEDADEWLVSLL